MDRNLGATSATPGSVGALGLLYQWGRKDPFLGSSSIWSSVQAVSTGTWSIKSGGSLADAEANPMTLYKAGLPDYSWGTKKTVYDPCPAGWRVPEGDAKGVWAIALGASRDLAAREDLSVYKDLSVYYDSSKCGVNLSGIFGDASEIWYPASGCIAIREDYVLYNVCRDGYYWSCSHYYEEEDDGLFLYFRDGYPVTPEYGDNKANALAVRCLKEQ